MNHENMKMTEVGWIPKDWEVKKVSNVATMPTATISSNSFDHKYYVGTDNMLPDKAGITLFEGTVNYNSVRQYKAGDTLISNIRPYLKKVWYADKNAGCSTDVIVFRAIENEVTPEYLHIALADDRYFKCVMDAPVGTKMPRGDKKVISDFCFALSTNPSEQRRIAEVLSDTDSLISSLSRTIEKKRLVKQGAMQQLLTGKTRLKGFTGEWVEKEFKEIYKSAREGGTPDTSKEEYYANGNIFFVKIDDMKNKYVVKADSKINEEGLRHSSAWMIPRRSILFSNGATIGRVCITNVDLCTKQGILGIVPKEEYNVEYLYYVLSSDEFMREVTSRITIGTMPIVYLNKLNEIKLYLPEDPNEQFAISERLRTMDNEIASLEAELQKYKALKQGMMQKLLTGQIRLK